MNNSILTILVYLINLTMVNNSIPTIIKYEFQPELNN